MNDEQLASEVRRAFDVRDVPNPGLEDRVIAAMDWNAKPRVRLSWARLRRLAGVATALAIVAAIAVVTSYSAAAHSASQTQLISQEAAIADAMKQLPNGGAGYHVLKAELEPSSKHFQFVGPDGSRFGEDDSRECLFIPPLPPLPWLTPCRYYPVWVVALSSPTCNATIAINAFTGRFDGGGTAVPSTAPASSSIGTCDLTPEAPSGTWFQASWG